MAKRHMEDVEARGYGDSDAVVCSVCVSEPALSSVIRDEGGDSQCDFCKFVPDTPDATAPLERVIELIVDGLRCYYEDPAESALWDSREGGYQVPLDDTHDLLWEYEVAENEAVVDAIAAAINIDTWCQRDPYAANDIQALQWGWSAFRGYVQNHRRFTFLSEVEDPAHGNGEIPMYLVPRAVVQAVEEIDLVTHFPAGSTWWRARVHGPEEDPRTASEIGTPANEFARDNRMSPKGIGAFYGASTQAGAQAEVAGYASPTDAATVGQFTQLTDLALVDLRNLPDAPSLFDEANRDVRAPRLFLRDFIKDVTKVADPDDSRQLEYIPTQIIAEHLRYDLPADGICWRSTRNRDVTVCVLFLPNGAMADQGGEDRHARLSLDPTTLKRLHPPLDT